MSDRGDTWTIHLTDRDITAARLAWQRAIDSLDALRADLLYEDLRRLVSAQAQQIAEHFRSVQTPCQRVDGCS